jgi:hypothetical protein
MSTRGEVGVGFEVLLEEPERVLDRVAVVGFFATKPLAVVEADSFDFARIRLGRVGGEAEPVARSVPVGALSLGMVSHRPIRSLPA